MPRKCVPFRLVEPSLKFYALIISVLLLSTQAIAQTTTDTLPAPCNDSDYQNCAALQSTADTKVYGGIIYSLASDADLLAALGSQQAVDDFKSRARTAANDWATRAGVSIREATSGETSNVTVSASDSQRARDATGYVDDDPNNSSRRVLVASSEYSGWSEEGKDGLFSHEWGHVIGLEDVPDDQCPGVNTIMRQTSTPQQLVNGYSGAQPVLNRPRRPVNCDLDKAKTEQNPVIVADGGGDLGSGGCIDCGGGGGGGYYCQPRYEWQYWQVCVSYGGGTDCDYGWDLNLSGYDCASF